MRTISRLLAWLFLVVLTAPSVADADEASPAPSRSAPPVLFATVSPIQIDNCRLDYQVGGLLGVLGKTTGALMIKFTNESDKAIVVARFSVDVDGKDVSVRDVGTFSPGITVDHKFKDYAGNIQFVFSRQPQPKCAVTFVKYADGTIWGEAVEPAPESTATPAPASTT